MKKALALGLVGILLVVIGLYYLGGSEERDVKIVGVLQFTQNNLSTLEGFKDALKVHGYAEGVNIRYVFDGPVATRDKLGDAMKRILAHKPDLIFASPTPAAIVAKKMTKGTGIPVLFAPVNDPISAGLVKEVSRPSGNVTGVRLSASDGRRLQSLLEVAPSVRRVFVPFTPGDKSGQASLDMLNRAANKMGVSLVVKKFQSDTDVLKDADYVPDNIDAIVLPRDGRVMSRIRSFVALCLKRKLPLSSVRFKQVEMGAVCGYGFTGYEVGRQAARMAHLILSGMAVSSVPVETSRDYLFLNLVTARLIGLDIDSAVIRRAHKIIR